MKITDTMVLALLKKGFEYQAKNIEVECETDIPLSALTFEETDAVMKMKIKCKVESLSMEINDGEA